MAKYLDKTGLDSYTAKFKAYNDNRYAPKGIDLSLYKIVSALPTKIADIQDNKIYLVSASTTTSKDSYSEYLYTGAVTSSATYDDSKWEKLGTYKAEVAITWDTLKDISQISTMNTRVTNLYNYAALASNIEFTKTTTEGTLKFMTSAGSSYTVGLTAATTAAAGLMTAAQVSKLNSALTTYTNTTYSAGTGITINTSSNNAITLKVAETSAIGGVKAVAVSTYSSTLNTNSGTAYGLEVKSDGTAFVRVPWKTYGATANRGITKTNSDNFELALTTTTKLTATASTAASTPVPVSIDASNKVAVDLIAITSSEIDALFT